MTGTILPLVGAILGVEDPAFPPNDEFDGWYHETQQRIRKACSHLAGSPILVDVQSRLAAKTPV